MDGGGKNPTDSLGMKFGFVGGLETIVPVRSLCF